MPDPGTLRRMSGAATVGWPACESGWSVPGARWAARCAATVLAHPDLELVAAVDPAHGRDRPGRADRDRTPGPAGHRASSRQLAAAGAEVVVDFTRVDAARLTLAYCAEAGDPRRGGDDRVHRGRPGRPASAGSPGPASGAPNCIVAANFAIGAVLMMRFAELAAPYFGRGRDRRAPPRREARRPLGHGAGDRRTDGRGPGGGRLGRVPARPDRHPGAWTGRRGGAGPGRDPHPLGPARPGWWPTRR